MITGFSVRAGNRIADIFRDNGIALCVCEHGEIWFEGGEDFCRDCSMIIPEDLCQFCGGR